MIGNRIRIITNDGFPTNGSVEGVLHKLDAAGALVFRTDVMPEAQGAIFIPMYRIREIVDLGRRP
jgi:hypothetical protein